MTDKQTPSVLIFDSGVGGLSVFQAIKDKLPQLSYYYLFDNLAYPYGELTDEFLIRRVVGLIGQFLAVNPKIDLLVIACNTASTLVLPYLRKCLSIPVVGVVPAIKPAAQLANKALGLLATPATINRRYIDELINEFSQTKAVIKLGSTRLVDMAEEKLRGHSVDLTELEGILFPLKQTVDAVVLGCTHFPLLKEEITQVLGKQILLVDSGVAIAHRVESILAISVTESVSTVRNHEIHSTGTVWEAEHLLAYLTQLEFKSIACFNYPL